MEATEMKAEGIGRDEDVEVAQSAVYIHDGDAESFWEHVGAWSRAVVSALDAEYLLLATTTDMLASSSPAETSGRDGATGETELEWLATHMGVVQTGTLTLIGTPRTATWPTCDRLPFELDISYPAVLAKTMDLPLREWVMGTLGMDTDRLRHTIYISDEEHAFLERLLEEDAPDGDESAETEATAQTAVDGATSEPTDAEPTDQSASE